MAMNPSSAPPVLLVAGTSPADVMDLSARVREILPDCTLLQSTDCSHARLLAEHHGPDAILLAVGSQAVEQCFSFKKSPATGDIPVVILSRSLDEDLRLRALDAGVDSCLPFPPNRLELAETLRTLVRLKRAVAGERRKEELLVALRAERDEEVERRQQRVLLNERHARIHRNLLHSLLEATSDAVFLMDAQFVFLQANSAFCHFVEKPREAVVDKFDVEVIPEPLLPLWHERIREVLDSGAQSTENFTHAGRMFEMTLFRVFIASGTWGVGGIARDVTARIVAQRELEEALEDWQHTFDTFNAAITILTPDHRIRRHNRLARELYDVPHPPARPFCWEIFHEDKKMHLQCPMERARRSLLRETMEIPQKDRWLRVTVDPILDVYGNFQGAVHTVADITAERQMQEHLDRMETQLQQAQKMEAIGRLAGGIAHDFNHLLSIVLSGAETAADLLETGHPAKAALQDVMDAAARSAEMTRQLLGFARRQPMEPRLLDAGAHLRGLHSLLQRLAGERVALHIDALEGEEYPVFMDPSQLGQILINLTINARDAISDSGDIAISVENVCVAQRDDSGIPEGEWVRLRVVDNGCGMPPEILSHVFEPFFTTKESGKGTGLGLATVWGIVQQNHGFIQVQSRLGEGTVFILHFPRTDPQGGRSLADTDSFTPLPDTKGTLLLVEDDPQLMRVTARILTDAGYRVLTARTPESALQTAESCGSGEIHALVTDIVLPEMTGIELARRIRQSHPRLPVLLVSGHAAETVEALLQEQPLHQIHFLPKPFTRALLLRKLCEMLGAAERI